ncbi:MAG: FAD-binding oxidoreductase [Pseudomonadota bacterium]
MVLRQARYLTANDTAGQHARSWYAETAGAMPDHPPLSGDTAADVCVIGGGYAGISTALHLAERGYDVLLLEANRIGWGASGRNGGQLGIGTREDVRKYIKAIGRDDAAKAWEIGVAANRLVRELIARHAIDCDLVDGTLEVAWKHDDARALRDYAVYMERAFSYDGIRTVEREELTRHLATKRYHGAVWWRDGGNLHPLRYALGLARAAAAAGARLREGTKVTTIRPGRVVTTNGAVRVEHVVVACNGYLDGLVPEVARRSMPINNYIATTAPLPDPTAVIDGRFSVVDTKFVLDYYRMTPDGRLLWGGGESYGPRFPRDIAAVVRRRITAVFPSLSDVALTHAWGGTLAITLPRFPSFQRLGSGMLAISGWSGSGVHMATMGGRIAADAIAGQAERFDVMARLPVPPFPGGDWFRRPALAAAMTWYALRDRL